ncbi:MAG: DUF3310 domain-containing protein [Fusobacteriaceae bacterium]
MERPVGEIFEYNGGYYEVCNAVNCREHCNECDFNCTDTNMILSCLEENLLAIRGLCGAEERKNGVPIVFKEVKNNSDKVNPKHYKGKSGGDLIDYLNDTLPKEEVIGFLKGNALKYLVRAGRKKQEETLIDLQKAKFYIERLINLYIPK